MEGAIRIAIDEVSQVAQARRAAFEMAAVAGFDEVRHGQVGIVVTEVCTNILKHAQRGEVLLSRTGADTGGGLEILALDKGPGMRDLNSCLADGYTTGSSPGSGLGAIRRLSSEADFYAAEGDGTAVLARWYARNAPPANLMRAGVVNIRKSGQDVCGDSWGLEQNEDFTTVVLADGLGHGFEASTASMAAVEVLHRHPGASAQELVGLMHQALRSTRGAAIAIARIDRLRDTVTFSGVGNIAAQIYAGSQPGPHLVSVNGTAGYQQFRSREFSYTWPRDGMLVLHSDGLTTATGLQTRPDLCGHDPSLIAGVLYREYSRGSDDSTVVVVKAAR